MSNCDTCIVTDCTGCIHDETLIDKYTPAIDLFGTDPADAWQYGWEPEQMERYNCSSSAGSIIQSLFTGGQLDCFRISMGNCFPDSPRGRLLAEAWAKYAPEIMSGVMASNEALAWKDAMYAMTIEEAEAAAGGE